MVRESMTGTISYHNRTIYWCSYLPISYSYILCSSHRSFQTWISLSKMLLRPFCQIKLTEVRCSCVLIYISFVKRNLLILSASIVWLIRSVSSEDITWLFVKYIWVILLVIILFFILRILSTPIIKHHILTFSASHHISICLLSIIPKSFILNFSLWIKKLSIAISKIIIEVSFILPAIIPSVNTISIFLIIVVMTFIAFYSIFTCLPYTIAASLSLLEISFVSAPISPNIFSESFRHSIDVLTFIIIPISIVFNSFSMF